MTERRRRCCSRRGSTARCWWPTRRGAGAVHPLYVSVGLAWEAAEIGDGRTAAGGAGLSTDASAPLQRLHFTMRDVYPPTHWAIRGTPPAYDTPDEDVYLTGRNLVLLAKAGTWCAQHRVSRIVLGPLAGNPFPDATAGVLRGDGRRRCRWGWIGRSRSTRRIATCTRTEVIQRGVELGVPFELTLSCMNPARGAQVRRCVGRVQVRRVARRSCTAARAASARERRDAFRGGGRAIAPPRRPDARPTSSRIVMPPSPVRTFSVEPPAPSRPRSSSLLLVAGPLEAEVAGVDGAIAGAGIEFGVDACRQLHADAAVAGRDLPVLLDGRRADSRFRADRSVAGVRLQRGGRAGDAHAAVAGVDVDFALARPRARSDPSPVLATTSPSRPGAR